jgi:hypothetical protein
MKAWPIVVLMLAGCATTPPVAPKILTEVKTVTVQVPVRVACLTDKDIPARPTRVMKADADVRGLAAGAVAELRAWEAYYAKADALLKGCL